MTEERTVPVHFAVPMRRVKQVVEVKQGMTIKEFFNQTESLVGSEQKIEDLADVVFNGTSVTELPNKYDTEITEESHLWGLVRSEGGSL